jgi:hypothetical protein
MAAILSCCSLFTLLSRGRWARQAFERRSVPVVRAGEDLPRGFFTPPSTVADARLWYWRRLCGGVEASIDLRGESLQLN